MNKFEYYTNDIVLENIITDHSTVLKSFTTYMKEAKPVFNKVVKEAKELESEKKYDEAIKKYQEGIKILTEVRTKIATIPDRAWKMTIFKAGISTYFLLPSIYIATKFVKAYLRYKKKLNDASTEKQAKEARKQREEKFGPDIEVTDYKIINDAEEFIKNTGNGVPKLLTEALNELFDGESKENMSVILEAFHKKDFSEMTDDEKYEEIQKNYTSKSMSKSTVLNNLNGAIKMFEYKIEHLKALKKYGED